MSLQTSKNLNYSSKWGVIPILNHDNYTEFREAARLAFVSSGSLGIVNDTEVRPEVQEHVLLDKYNERKHRAIGILNGSAGLYKKYLKDYIDTEDVVGMWEKLKEKSNQFGSLSPSLKNTDPN